MSSTARTRIGLALICHCFPFAKQPRTGAVVGHSVSSGTRNAQLDLRAGSHRAPDFELSAGVLSALAHALQAPATFPASLDQVRIDSGSIVPNPHPQKTLGVLDLRFNFGRLRVAEGIL